ncbi:MAG: NADH-quinone oxidoreductase subunit L [Anaerolineales bacterium]|nr:NADH-quinone oxidoreductase subunit L [Anaerolineales bacterium]
MHVSEAAVNAWFALVPLIIAFPVAGLLINLALGRRLGERFTGFVASAAVALAFGVAVLQGLALLQQPEGARVVVADWITIGGLSVPWAIKVDTLSVTMMLMVTGVSTLIHIYATGYMHDDVRFQGDPGRYTRFFIFFNLFVAAMMILISGDSFLTLFVGWEGVGLCSYLLIGFWYEKGKDGVGNARAGKKAFVANRIGDFGFLIAMFLTFWAFGSLTFDTVFEHAEAAGPQAGLVLTLITLFLLLGAAGKSAQLPLYVWLPDAMAGPTPVSALIHAATMVTAGVYMITRTHVVFHLAPVSSSVVAIVGAATAFFAATIAVGQFDIKKVLAYSTISQLGFMVAAVGMGAYVAGMFHLVTHAFFKALLFLGSGSVILGVEHGHHHATQGHGDAHGGHFDPQDMRNMGGMASRMKVTFIVYLIGALALAGIPPLAGFFSKDEILLAAQGQNLLVYILLTAAAFLTAFYMGRQVFLVFFGQPRSQAAAHARENPPLVVLPLVALAGLSLLGGALNLPGVHTLGTWLGHTLGEEHAPEFSLFVAGVSTVLALAAIALAWWIYARRPLGENQPDPIEAPLGGLFRALNNKWWVDEFYEWLVIRRYVRLANLLAHQVDTIFWHNWFHDSVLAAGFRRGTRWLAESFDLPVIDGASAALARLVERLGASLRRMQSGYVRNYAVYVLAGVVLMLSFFLVRSLS